MPLETASTIADLVTTNPVGASDTPAALDDHIRLIKTVLKADAMGVSTTHAASSKSTPVDADELPLSDSAASWGLKKLTWANLKATAKAYFDTLYSAKGANSDITSLSGLTTPLSVAQGGSGVATLAGLLKGNGGSAFSSAVAGTDYAASGGNILEKTAAGLGYGTGAGGTVTQPTTPSLLKSNPVTLNKPTGQITMNNAALAAGATVAFTLNNNLLGSYDCFSVGVGGGGSNPDSYSIRWRMGGGGAVVISVTNTSGVSLAEALILNFAVIKGAIS